MADRTKTAPALGKTLPKLDNNKASIETLVPVEIRDLLGEPPLLATEDPNQYDALLTELAREVRPSDFIEWLWVKDIADLTWDIIRYRCIKASYIDGRIQTALVDELTWALQRDKRAAHPDKWLNFDLALIRDDAIKLADDFIANENTKEKRDKWLKAHCVNAESITATSFDAAVDKLEAIERMLASVEYRRNNALHEIERRRNALGRALRQTSDQIIEGEAPLVPLAAK
jgi:hypothetical protein